ncbi:NUDIX domain-containing protein [Planctomycetota bacterium]
MAEQFLNRGKWEMPGGKAEAGEAFADALIREVAEETGLTVSLERAAGLVERELPHVHVVTVIMEARLLAGDVHLSEEHDEAAWVPLGELARVDLVEEFLPWAREYSRGAETG